MHVKSATPKPCASSTASAADAVREALAGIRYGTVLVTVHDGRVVQLDVTERHRFT